MCEICISAFDALKPKLEELEQQFPGTIATHPDGTSNDVSPTHHVLVALQAAVRLYTLKEMRHQVLQQAVPETFFGTGKVAEA